MLGAVLALFATPGCRKHDHAGTSTPAASDRFADGKRLDTALAEWRTRWQSETEPPSCATLLPPPEEKQQCLDAAAALVKVKAHADALDRTLDALHDAVTLARSAASASQRLRYRDMEYMGREGIALSAPSVQPSAAPSGFPIPLLRPRPAPSAATGASPTPSASASSGPDGVRHDNPYQPVVRAYSKLEAEALRYLGAFLEVAPLPLRNKTLDELLTLWPESGRPSHPLQQIVRQASLLEPDPALKERLQKLDAKTHLTPPASSAH